MDDLQPQTKVAETEYVSTCHMHNSGHGLLGALPRRHRQLSVVSIEQQLAWQWHTPGMLCCTCYSTHCAVSLLMHPMLLLLVPTNSPCTHQMAAHSNSCALSLPPTRWLAVRGPVSRAVKATSRCGVPPSTREGPNIRNMCRNSVGTRYLWEHIFTQTQARQSVTNRVLSPDAATVTNSSLLTRAKQFLLVCAAGLICHNNIAQCLQETCDKQTTAVPDSPARQHGHAPAKVYSAREAAQLPCTHKLRAPVTPSRCTTQRLCQPPTQHTAEVPRTHAQEAGNSRCCFEQHQPCTC